MATLFAILFPETGKEGLGRLFRKIGVMWKNNGIVFTIKYLKASRLHVTKYMVGQPLKFKEHLDVKVNLDSDGFPRVYQEWKSLFTSQLRRDVVKGLTLVTISRAIRRSKYEPLPISLDSITKPTSSIIQTLNESVMRKVLTNMKLVRSLQIKDLETKDYSVFSSAGPDGPSSKTALLTLKRMSFQLIR